MSFKALRTTYHQAICQQVLGYRGGIPNIADRGSKRSIELAERILQQLRFPLCATPPTGQKAEALFESITMEYLQQAFSLLSHLRPGQWLFYAHGNLTDFAQYEHLSEISQVLAQYPILRTSLGDYLITPDIVIGRQPVSDAEINQSGPVYHGETAKLTPLRAQNSVPARPILHASISCKWTIRSDRSPNARTESLNLIRNRKGNTPHIAIVTAEPLPSRIASVALGTGDVDCVYHLALDELRVAVAADGDETSLEMLNLLVNGKRLRDISDLPFDLAI